jgi:hypothetical protein
VKRLWEIKTGISLGQTFGGVFLQEGVLFQLDEVAVPASRLVSQADQQTRTNSHFPLRPTTQPIMLWQHVSTPRRTRNRGSKPPAPTHRGSRISADRMTEPAGRPVTATDRAGQTGTVLIAIPSETFPQTREQDLPRCGVEKCIGGISWLV